MSIAPSPIRPQPGQPYPVCITCTAAERQTVLATDPVTHVQECHPEATDAVVAQYAPRHHKIVRSAR